MIRCTLILKVYNYDTRHFSHFEGQSKAQGYGQLQRAVVIHTFRKVSPATEGRSHPHVQEGEPPLAGRAAPDADDCWEEKQGTGDCVLEAASTRCGQKETSEASSQRTASWKGNCKNQQSGMVEGRQEPGDWSAEVRR